MRQYRKVLTRRGYGSGASGANRNGALQAAVAAAGQAYPLSALTVGVLAALGALP